ncbi:DUF6090 family protein [Fulvivirga sedimenti]|uniref:Uncharacterized protein n=1 Tax=Fulvivirga sedimenti TaxID=2879465 RepID=A0A9X1HL21_9BACT|nr:DUF6090 family protein [Fulvivirga sedimenti]MCA6073965.1 hypothetical protein [Fulvivirga sedimenti]
MKFFRRIRFDLMGKNKKAKDAGPGLQAGRYLKYAIGEIILVVIGILIALSINNWNEQRKDRIQEQKILKQLAAEFRTNLAQLESKIQLRENIMQQSADVLRYIDLKQEVSIDTLFRKISVVLLAPTFDPIQNEELNSDKIQLIRNDSLRHFLSTWSSSIANLREQENEWVNLLNNYAIPLFIDLGISRNLNISFYEDPENMNYLLDKSRINQIRIPKSDNMPPVSEILNNKKIEGILSNAVLLNEGINWESEGYRNRIIEIIHLIESEIK